MHEPPLRPVRGRFAPSPSGRMHLGNLFSCLLAWLDVRSLGGEMVLRMEDLDAGRCRPEFAARIADDLRWLGLDWDVGWDGNEAGRLYAQSARRDFYEAGFHSLDARGLVYPCYCSRAERVAASAPHPDGGETAHVCRCRTLTREERRALESAGRMPAFRITVPGEIVSLNDGHYGVYRENLAEDCGDFILRRSDGVFAYQLAVTVDDGLMGITRVVRGRDLLSSAPRQVWLHRMLGFTPPEYCHVPLLLAPDGRRLSKRERDLDMEMLRGKFTPDQLIGRLAFLAGLLPLPDPITAEQLVPLFSWPAVGLTDIRLPPGLFA